MGEVKEGTRYSERKEYYTQKVSEYLSKYPQTFKDFVGNPEIVRFGDELLSRRLSTGYNFATSEQFPVRSTGPIILYSVYAQRTDHFGELLALMEQKGIIDEADVRFGVRASKILGEYEDPEPIMSKIKMRDGSVRRSVESVEGVVIFWPTSATQTIRVARFLLEEARGIKGAFVDPDARASADLAPFIEEIGFKKAVANVYSFEKGNIIALKQKTSLGSEQWKDFPILLHHRLYSYLVSSEVKP